MMWWVLLAVAVGVVLGAVILLLIYVELDPHRRARSASTPLSLREHLGAHQAMVRRR